MRVGYIGLGQMGASMVDRLLATDHDVVVFDLRSEATDAAASAGATVATTPAEVAAVCDVVSICVPAAAHIDAVLAGPDGVLQAARPELTVLVHSTVAPQTIESAAAAAAAVGVTLFDACVAGGGEAAKLGELVILAGGVESMPEPVRTLLDSYGSRVIDGGPVGGGATLKLGVNIMTYAQFAASGAAFELAVANGADTAALVDAWRHIDQLGALTEQFLPILGIPAEHITGAFRDGMLRTVDIAEKDLALAAEAMPPGPRADVLAALERAMPDIFGVADEPQETTP